MHALILTLKTIHLKMNCINTTAVTYTIIRVVGYTVNYSGKVFALTKQCFFLKWSTSFFHMWSYLSTFSFPMKIIHCYSIRPGFQFLHVYSQFKQYIIIDGYSFRYISSKYNSATCTCVHPTHYSCLWLVLWLEDYSLFTLSSRGNQMRKKFTYLFLMAWPAKHSAVAR